jgi:hypothetical protein
MWKCISFVYVIFNTSVSISNETVLNGKMTDVENGYKVSLLQAIKAKRVVGC